MWRRSCGPTIYTGIYTIIVRELNITAGTKCALPYLLLMPRANSMKPGCQLSGKVHPGASG